MTDQQERDTEREAFEAWAVTQAIPQTDLAMYSLVRRPDGHYRYPSTHHAWLGYQAARSQQQQQWRPISEAPEGSDDEILVFKPRVGILVVRWLASDDHDCQGEFWHTSWDHSVIEDATHWMPLPAPPALSDLTGGRNG